MIAPVTALWRVLFAERSAMSQKRNHRHRQAECKSIPAPPVKRSCSRAVLTVLLVLSLGLGIWFALVPMLENEQALAAQQRILAEYEAHDLQPSASVSVTPAPAPSPKPEPLVVFEPAPESLPEAVPYSVPENSGNQAIGVLEVGRIDLKLPVVEGIDKAQLDAALGHIPEIAPVGGVGNAVIAGHRSYAYGKFLNRLGEVEVGDKLAYTDAAGQRYTFSVYEILELLPDDQSAFEPYTEKSVLSLYTCTPTRTATHRLVVRAERIE